MLVVLGVLVALVSVALLVRELRSYQSRDDNDDLFIYSRKRLVRRLVGLVVLLAVGATIIAWEIAPPDDPGAAVMFSGLLVGEMIALVVIGVLDLRETSKTARVGRG